MSQLKPVTSAVSELTAKPAVGVVSHIVFGEPYSLPPLRMAIASQIVKAAEGRYALQDGSTFTLRGLDGRLFVESVGQQTFQLVASGDTTAPAGAARLNAESRAIAELLIQGDISLLLTSLDRGSHSAEVAKKESGLLEYRRETFGDFRSSEVPDVEGGLPLSRTHSRSRSASILGAEWHRLSASRALFTPSADRCQPECHCCASRIIRPAVVCRPASSPLLLCRCAFEG